MRTNFRNESVRRFLIIGLFSIVFGNALRAVTVPQSNQAFVNFDSNKKYRLVSQAYEPGSVCIGA